MHAAEDQFQVLKPLPENLYVYSVQNFAELRSLNLKTKKSCSKYTSYFAGGSNRAVYPPPPAYVVAAISGLCVGGVPLMRSAAHRAPDICN